MNTHLSALFTRESSPPGPTGRAQIELRDRMLRDAIVDVLRSAFEAPGDGQPVSIVDAGLIGHLAVEGGRVRVELPLSSEWSPFAGPLVSEIQRRVQALPEVAATEIAVTSRC
jgi:metal-sulfur cluster biosynthetic enzyme